MKHYFLLLLTVMAFLPLPTYAQRSTTSDYNYRKAVDAYCEDKDPDKTLEFVNEALDDNLDHIDARFFRSNIYWLKNKFDAALRDVTLKNISASVVKNQKAPLLLGQSVLERFGAITIDNNESKLVIRHQKNN